MKKTLLFALFISALALPTQALVTPEECVTPELIQNQGYSAEMARLVNVRHYQAAAKVPELDTTTPEYYKKFNWIRKFFIYSDPALDDGSFMRHNIHPTPSVYDY